SAALRRAAGRAGFVGDAIADPFAGLYAARTALARGRRGGRLILAMSAIVAEALGEERARDAAGLDGALRSWADSIGQPFPPVAVRPGGRVAAFGADSAAWLGRC
ncbi:MAG: CoA transferase, partial [Novosphingobium sp.]